MLKALTLFFLFSVFNPLIKAQESKTEFTTYWDKGFHLDNANFKMKFGGRIQQHWTFFSQSSEIDSAFGSAVSGGEFRRLRFYNSGKLYNSVAYKLQFDFTGGAAKVKDAYITLTDLPAVGNLRFGHFKEPFGLDQMNSSNDMTFIERTPSYELTPGRNNGILSFNTLFNKRITWAVGVYKETNSFGKTIPEDKYNITGRITGLPLFNKEKNLLLHLGLAYSYRSQYKNEFHLKSRPEAHLAPIEINTGILTDVQNNQRLGAEFAFMANSFSVQGEYILSAVNSVSGIYNFSAYYIETSYFLTGESRKYSQSAGYFKRSSPQNNFDPTEKTKGAWQIAIRYSNTDYTDGIINGGNLTSITTGLNWYLNPVTRFSFNHTYSQRIEIGTQHIGQFKFQLTF